MPQVKSRTFNNGREWLAKSRDAVGTKIVPMAFNARCLIVGDIGQLKFRL
jgi:hypothetical protein